MNACVPLCTVFEAREAPYPSAAIPGKTSASFKRIIIAGESTGVKMTPVRFTPSRKAGRHKGLRAFEQQRFRGCYEPRHNKVATTIEKSSCFKEISLCHCVMHSRKEELMSRADEKTRIGFWIENDLLKQCDDCWKVYGFSSRNEFVNRAIEQYIATLTIQISKGLFRYAVGQEMIMHMLAAISNITADEVWELRARAIKNVRKTRGKVSLEAIADFQHENEVRELLSQPDEYDAL